MTEEQINKLLVMLQSIDKSLKVIADILKRISQNRPYFKKKPE